MRYRFLVLVAMMLLASLGVVSPASASHDRDGDEERRMTTEEVLAVYDNEVCSLLTFPDGALKFSCPNQTGVETTFLVVIPDDGSRAYIEYVHVNYGARFSYYEPVDNHAEGEWLVADGPSLIPWTGGYFGSAVDRFEQDCRTVLNQVRKCSYDGEFWEFTTWTRNTDDRIYAEVELTWRSDVQMEFRDGAANEPLTSFRPNHSYPAVITYRQLDSAYTLRAATVLYADEFGGFGDAYGW